MTNLLWKPDQSRINNSKLSQFLSYLSDEFDLEFSNYEALHQWSVDSKELFWSSLVKFSKLKGSFDFSRVFQQEKQFYQSKWFPSSTLNFAENLLPKSNDDIAIIERGEDGRRKEISYKTLNREVERIAGAMRELGIQKGDRVAGFLPNCSEAIIAMLATTSLGAIWSSCSPDFGRNGVIDRLGQISPKLLFATNGYNYSGKCISSTSRVSEIVDSLEGLEKLVIIEYIEKESSPSYPENSTLWSKFKATSLYPLKFEQVSFSDPLYVMYSSGTTGIPKCIVHSVGGTLLQHVKELALHTDLKEDDKFFYYTTCGWMMWNWLVSGLSQGTTLVLFDGSPFHPTPNTLFDLVDEESISIFGVSAKFFSACDKANLHPKTSHKLRSLKSILSTGSPLSHESYDYIYQQIKSDICVSSISGGTDIISCFALGMPTQPVYRGELQCAGLGMDIAFYNDQGASLESGKGELVCLTPFPSMPIRFWNDNDNVKYQKAYFNTFKNIWAHGDYGEFVNHYDENKLITQRGVVIHGRSDAVLNPGGVRIGTAEIYRQVEKVDAVLESIAIGQKWQDDTRVVLFVKLNENAALTNDLIKEIKTVIRTNTTPRHVPAKIIQIADIPRTISGKIVELAVRNVVHGIEVKNKDALANPEVLELFKNINELKM